MNLDTQSTRQRPHATYASRSTNAAPKAPRRHTHTHQTLRDQRTSDAPGTPESSDATPDKAPTLRIPPSARSQLKKELNYRHNPLRLAKAQLPQSQTDREDQRRAILEAASKLGDNVVLSHTSAWLAHGYALPYELIDDTIYVYVPKGNIRVRRSNVRCMRRSSMAETTTITGVTVTTPAQTWLDVGHLKPSLAIYVSMADCLVGRSDRKLAHLQRFISGAGACKGVGLARRALPLVRNGAESVKETETRLRILSAGLPEPELNHNIYDTAGRLMGRADMMYRAQKVIVEYDGACHGSDKARRRDAQRRNALQHDGWKVLTVTQSSFDDPDQEWLQQLRRLLRP